MTAAARDVAPAVLGDRIRANWLVSQCMVVGDNKPFIAALITLDVEALLAWLEQKDRPADTRWPTWPTAGDRRRGAGRGGRTNKAVSNAEAIRNSTSCRSSWTEGGGQLTPSMKLQAQRRDERIRARGRGALHLIPPVNVCRFP